MRDLTFEALRTVGFVERHGVRWPIIHPDDRYRQLGRALIRDAFQLLPEDLPGGPCRARREPPKWDDFPG